MLRHILFYKILITLIVFQLTTPAFIISSEWDRQRIWLGLKLFPTMLSADLNLHEKTDDQETLRIVLLYKYQKNFASDIAKKLAQKRTIGNFKIEIDVTDDLSLKKYSHRKVAGVFLCEKLYDKINPIIQFGKTNHVIIFSPFEKDVQAGVSGGMVIYDRILPYINSTTMKLSDIQLAPIFLEIAETYD